MHDEFPLDFLGPILLLFLLGSGIIHKTQVIFVVDRELLILHLPICLEYVVNNLLSPV